jgi:hypothetical protein
MLQFTMDFTLGHENKVGEDFYKSFIGVNLLFQ